jgi:hypothetical protein
MVPSLKRVLITRTHNVARCFDNVARCVVVRPLSKHLSPGLEACANHTHTRTYYLAHESRPNSRNCNPLYATSTTRYSQCLAPLPPPTPAPRELQQSADGLLLRK